MKEQLTPFDDRAESFLQIGDVAYGIATNHSHVEVDEITHERWRQVMALLREIDTIYDTRDLSIRQVMEYLTDSSSPFFDRYPALFPDEMDEDNYQALLKRARRIFQLGEFISETHSVNHYISFRLLEARQTANLMLDSATDNVRAQTAFHESFMPVLRSLAETANMFDSLTDARKDYEQKKIRINPDREFYKHIARTAIRSAAPGISSVFHPPIMKQFAVMSVHRLRNRLKHLDSKNSSLNIIR